jgi:hypothetical protein
MPLPPEDREWLEKHGIVYREELNGNDQCLIFGALPLPTGKYNANQADILNLLPSNYPDVGPDMFYVRPRLTLANGQLARATDANGTFLGETWQRWSRHWSDNPWRAGLDDIQTIYRRITRALNEAA